MKKIVGLFVLFVIAVVVSATSCQIAFTPLPVSKLPPPDERAIDAPAGTLIYTNENMGVINEMGSGNHEKEIKHLTPEEWREQAEEKDVVPIMIFNHRKRVDLFLFKPGRVFASYDAPTASGLNWPSGTKTKRIEFDRIANKITYYPSDHHPLAEFLGPFGIFSGIVALALCFLLFVVVSDWRWQRWKKQEIADGLTP